MFDPKEAQTSATDATMALGRLGSMGITLALGTSFFAGLGWLLDRRLGSSPWFVALLGLLGGAASLYKFIRDVARLEAPRPADKQPDDGAKDD